MPVLQTKMLSWAVRPAFTLESCSNADTCFCSDLNSVLIDYSYKHPTLFTITVDGAQPMPSPHHAVSADVSQWHLPAADPHNQGKYMFKIHTIDIYLWTVDDGSLFLDSLK